MLGLVSVGDQVFGDLSAVISVLEGQDVGIVKKKESALGAKQSNEVLSVGVIGNYLFTVPCARERVLLDLTNVTLENLGKNKQEE